MVIGIGDKHAARHPEEDAIVHRLASCHARIRAALAEARALARGAGSAEARRASAEAVARYFRVALPLHAEDEDRLIAPQLPETSAELSARLAAEHADIDAQLPRLLEQWDRWAVGASEAPSVDHVERVERLARALETHLDLEELELFPQVETIPTVVARSLGAAMQLRRRRPEEPVYRFEAIDASLPLVPLAGRRALDAAGRKLSLESWRAMPLPRRREIVAHGSAERVEVEKVRAALVGFPCPVIEGRPDPDAAHVPGAVRAALGSDVELDDLRWSVLRALDRWAFASLADRGRFDGLRTLAAELGVITPRPPGG